MNLGKFVKPNNCFLPVVHLSSLNVFLLLILVTAHEMKEVGSVVIKGAFLPSAKPHLKILMHYVCSLPTRYETILCTLPEILVLHRSVFLNDWCCERKCHDDCIYIVNACNKEKTEFFMPRALKILLSTVLQSKIDVGVFFL